MLISSLDFSAATSAMLLKPTTLSLAEPQGASGSERRRIPDSDGTLAPLVPCNDHADGQPGMPSIGFSITEGTTMELLNVVFLFAVTAVTKIVGCHLPWQVFNQGKSAWTLISAAISLALCVWLLTLYPSAAGHTTAAYGGVYIAVALAWLHWVDGVALTR
jgi:small multidrug resistance family-3 protein